MQHEYNYRYSCYVKYEGMEAHGGIEIKKIDDFIDYYDFTIVFSGELEYQINDISYTLKKGDAIFIPPDSHRIRASVKKPVEFVSINFFSENKIQLPLHMPSCITSTLKELTLLHIKLKNEKNSKFFKEKLSSSINMLILILTENAEKKLINSHVNSILDYIRNHYTENITLENIASSVFLTVPYCCNLVKKELGLTIYDIILQERILLAQEYITEGLKTLQEISYLCGFNDYSNFSKYFKKYTGVPTSKYKI